MELTKEFYSIREVAEMLGVHYQTVRYWIAKGHVKAVKMGLRMKKIPKREVEKLIENFSEKG